MANGHCYSRTNENTYMVIKLVLLMISHVHVQISDILVSGQPVPVIIPDFPGFQDVPDFLNFSVISDPTIRRYSQEYNTFCPHTFMCNVLINFNNSLFQKYGEFQEEPCCGPCSCYGDCLNTLDCCLDGLPRLLTTKEVKSIYESPKQCMYAQFRAYHKEQYNGLGYVLVTKCADDTVADSTVKDNCLKEYSEFDFATDIPAYFPVTDNTTMVSYKNEYCALCNDIPKSNLIYWGAKVECETVDNREDTGIQSLSDVYKLITEDSTCNVVFLIPYELLYRQPFIQQCIPYQNRCNMTGRWQEYDADLESLCLSYESAYKGYKNVHCYLCNGYDVSTIEEICIGESPNWLPSSFITLLDFNDLEVSDEDLKSSKERKCSKNQKYDHWTKSCRSLTCPISMVLSQGKCKPTFEEMNVATFEIQIRLIPMKQYTDVRIISSMMMHLAEDISLMANNLQSADAETCDIHLFLKLNETLESRKDRFQQIRDITYTEKVKHIVVRISITAHDIQNTSRTLEEIISDLMRLNFDITGGFNVNFADINFDSYEQHLHLSPDNIRSTTTMHMPPVSMIPEWSPYDPGQYMLSEAFPDPVDGLGVLPVFPINRKHCSRVFRISPYIFCPIVTLSSDEYVVEHSKDKLFLKHKHIYINTSSVIFTNNNSIELCQDDYFSGYMAMSPVPSKHNPYMAEVIVSIVCTCVSMFCLAIVFVIYCTFQTLRTLPGLNTMALVLSLFFAQLFYLIGGVIEIQFEWLCEAIGLLLHFTLTSSFFWMGVCTFHMMKVFVFIARQYAVENVRSMFVKYEVFVLISSAVLVCINIIVSIVSDNPSSGYGGQPCYITSRHMILYTVAIPLGVIILNNFTMFLYVIIKVSRLPEVKKNTKHERRNIIIFAKLSTLTGLTWIFAYLYQWTGVKAFAYLFIVANASQGLFIMISFIINRRVFDLVMNSRKNKSLYSRSNNTKYTLDQTRSSKSVESSVKEHVKA